MLKQLQFRLSPSQKPLGDRVNIAIVRTQLAVQHWTRRCLTAASREEGQTMAEYVVMLVIVGLALAAVVVLGGTIRDKFLQVNGQISGAY